LGGSLFASTEGELFGIAVFGSSVFANRDQDVGRQDAADAATFRHTLLRMTQE